MSNSLQSFATGAARVVKVAAHPAVHIPAAAAVSATLARRGVPRANTVFGATLATYVISETAKRIIGRQRPNGYHGPHPRRSFPSGHTAGAAAVAFTTAAVMSGDDLVSGAAAAAGALAVTAIVGASRVVLDEHWPADVVAGAALGYAVARAAVSLADG